MSRHERLSLKNEMGLALLVTLFALLIFSVLGLFMTLNATTSLQISDNFESQSQATYAALAGLNHAAVLLRGLAFNDVLRGPDGTFNGSASYLNQAKSFQFRLPFPLISAQSLNMRDPTADIAGTTDDGIINTGFFNGTYGTELIPIVGIPQFAPNPYGLGQLILSRYFVKVTDNNGDASEIAGDSDDHPFVDGDGVVIVRSVGVSSTFSEQTGTVSRRNSVAIFETRLKRSSTWNLGPALVVIGSQIDASFYGEPEIIGNQAPGIGTIDIAEEDAIFPDQIIYRAAETTGSITGGGLTEPSVLDITNGIRSNPDQVLLLKPQYLWEFIHVRASRMADTIFEGSQDWIAGSVPFLGSYDSTRPWNAPDQDPRITLVNGNLRATEGLSGGGLLIITGDFSCSGPIAFNGLVLVIGSGNLAISGAGQGIVGGLVVASLAKAGESIAFGIPDLSIGGNSRIIADRNMVLMALSLIPATQISFREIVGTDP
jgi:hypothetical protein